MVITQPLQLYIRACSSAGRAFGSHPRGRGFESLQVHQMDIGRTSIISKAVSPLKFDSDVKTEKEGQGCKNLGSLFVVLGVLAVFLLLQPFLQCRLAFLTVIILSDFRNQMSCKGIDDRLRQLNVEFASVGHWAPPSIFGFADFIGAEMKKRSRFASACVMS